MSQSTSLCQILIILTGYYGDYIQAERISGPIFIIEPKGTVEYLNTQGARIDCSAYGDPEPAVKWYKDGGEGRTQTKVVNMAPLIRAHRNGSLLFGIFVAEQFRQDVHAAEYTCRASNAHGTIVSTPVTVKATTVQQQQQLQAQVYDQYVISGNTAVLKCHIPAFFKDDLQVIAWIREDNHVITANQTDKNAVVSANGNLHIKRVTSSMRLNLGYWCQVKNRLTGQTFLSQTAGRVKLTEPPGSIQPKISEILQTVSATKGEYFELTCAAQGHPTPSYRWVSDAGEQFQTGGDTITRRKAEKSGTFAYTCIAENKYEVDERDTVVTITEPLAAFIEPNFQVVNSGEGAEIECSISGYPVDTIEWKLNGGSLTASAVVKKSSNNKKISIVNVGRQHEGMYQCFVKNNWQQVQASAQILLGDVSPSFVRTFKSKTLQPGPSISLRCVAIGKPIPEIYWKINGKVIEADDRLIIRKILMKNGTSRSDLIVKNIRVKDGGEYSCVAYNKIKSAIFKDVVNVYGLPLVQEMKNVTVAAGEDVSIRCFVSGYPITSITWQRGDVYGYLPRHANDFGNGTLQLINVKNNKDEGNYICTAENGRGQQDRKSIYINILLKPKIAGTKFQVLDFQIGEPFSTFCSVQRGDEPIRISWLKNNESIKLGIGTDVATTKMYSVLQIREINEEHAGNYTCRAQNLAGRDSVTVQVRVLVSPRWMDQPSDSFSVVGHDVTIPCQAKGFPEPQYEWFRVKGKQIRPFIFKNSKHKVAENGSLIMKDIDRSDAGKYSCIVSNGVVPDLTEEIILVIGERPSIKFINESSTIKLGEKAIIVCKYKGDNATVVHWSKGSTSVKSDDKRVMTVLNFGRTTGISILTILKTARMDEGEYSCRVSNQYGTDVASTNIKLSTGAVLIKSNPKSTEAATTTTIKPSTYTTSITPVMRVTTDKSLTKGDFETQKDASQGGNFGDIDKDKESLQLQPSAGPAMETKSMFDDHFEFNNILFIIPAVVVVILLIAVIITLIIYLFTRKDASNISSLPAEIAVKRDSMQGTLSNKNKLVYESLDRRYGRLERPLPTPVGNNDRISAAYEIPDYYAGMKPCSTLQLTSRRASPAMMFNNRDSQSSV